MRAFYTQVSGLAGLLAFLNQLWDFAPLDRTILVGVGTGLVVYLLLVVGDLAVSRILEHTPPRLAGETTGAAADAASGRPAAESDRTQPATA